MRRRRHAVSSPPTSHTSPALFRASLSNRVLLSEPGATRRERSCTPETSRGDQFSGLATHAPRPFSRGMGIYSLLCASYARIDWGALLRHLQRRTPGRYHPGHLRSLQRGLRRLRAALSSMRKPSHLEGIVWDVVPPPRSSAPIGPKEETTSVSHIMPDTEGLPQTKLIEAPSSLEEKPPPLSKTRLAHMKMTVPTTPASRSVQEAFTHQEGLLAETSDSPLARAIQEHIQANRSPKTLGWHRVALGFLQRHLHSQHILFVQGLTRYRIESWIR